VRRKEVSLQAALIGLTVMHHDHFLSALLAQDLQASFSIFSNLSGLTCDSFSLSVLNSGMSNTPCAN
jgi:hypothetical protein